MTDASKSTSNESEHLFRDEDGRIWTREECLAKIRAVREQLDKSPELTIEEQSLSLEECHDLLRKEFDLAYEALDAQVQRAIAKFWREELNESRSDLYWGLAAFIVCATLSLLIYVGWLDNFMVGRRAPKVVFFLVLSGFALASTAASFLRARSYNTATERAKTQFRTTAAVLDSIVSIARIAIAAALLIVFSVVLVAFVTGEEALIWLETHWRVAARFNDCGGGAGSDEQLPAAASPSGRCRLRSNTVRGCIGGI
jgi:hypothetical protein